MNIANKIILITGGAVRVGRAISLELAGAGATVCCHYHTSKKAALELKSMVEKTNGHIWLFQADLSVTTNAVNLVRQVIDTFGRIDVLINNASIFFKTPFGTVSEEQWDQFLNLNLKAAFFLSQEAGKQMSEQKEGKIINIADSGALHPFPSYLPYSISKAGLMALTKGLAKALAPYVQVSCVNPGPVLFPNDFPDKEKEFAINQTLLKRAGTAEDVARTVRFLIENDYITGECVAVDGGRQIR